MSNFDANNYRDISQVKVLLEEQERANAIVAQHDRVQALLLEEERAQKRTAVTGHFGGAAPTIPEMLARYSIDDLRTVAAAAALQGAHPLAADKSTFYLPAWDLSLEQEVKRLVADNHNLSAAVPKNWIQDLRNSVLQRQHPWFDDRNATASVRAMTEIQVLGSAINAANPFGDVVTEATRKVLGDWSTVGALPNEIFNDADARRDFYLAHGYDATLSSLSRAARRESMHYAGFDERPPVLVDATPQAESQADSEKAGLERAAEARESLVNIERELRSFMQQKMLASHGHNWMKQRVPADNLRAIRMRRQEDIKRRGADHPLIEYLDFSDYAPILTRNDNWNDVFKAHFDSVNAVEETFRRLTPLRNAAMHCRPLTEDDILFLLVEIKRLQMAMKRVSSVEGDTEED